MRWYGGMKKGVGNKTPQRLSLFELILAKCESIDRLLAWTSLLVRLSQTDRHHPYVIAGVGGVNRHGVAWVVAQ